MDKNFLQENIVKRLGESSSKIGFIQDSYTKVISFIDNNEWKGYDPYDGNASEIKLLKKYYYTRLFLTYFHKFCPLNTRLFFRIPKTQTNQALAFIVRALAPSKGGGNEFKRKIMNGIKHLLNNSERDTYGRYCWSGLSFPVQMRSPENPHAPVVPDIIATETCARVFIECQDYIFNEIDNISILREVAEYFIDYHLIENKNGRFFKYYPDSPNNEITYNASAIAAAYLIDVDNITGQKNYKDIVDDCFDLIIKYQHSDGHWNYKINLETGFEKKQVDFHQGFILDCLVKYLNIYGKDFRIERSYLKGLDFYFNKQFLPNGQGIYRYPKKYPVNIHNQAQGIITFTRAAAAGFGDHYLEFARTIAEWTIINMQDPDGHFYYLKYPFFTNKIPYIRWSDAAMAYALSVYLDAVERRSSIENVHDQSH